MDQATTEDGISPRNGSILESFWRCQAGAILVTRLLEAGTI